MRIFSRNRWPVVIGLYDARQCPQCGATVLSDPGQRVHQAWHDRLDEDLDTALGLEPESAPEPGGYVIGAGPLPASVRGGWESETDAKTGERR